jgi:repressor of nif and glnA expression
MLRDKMNVEIADMLSENPSISAKEGMRELKKRGWQISEENFRVRKQRLLRPAYKAADSY